MNRKVLKTRLTALMLMLALVIGVYTPVQTTATAAIRAGVDKTESPSDNWVSGYAFKDNAEFNRLVDENYVKLQANPQGYEELRIPKSIHGIGRDKISVNALTVADKLIENGYDAYVIGGCMRDYALGRECDDFDLSTNATVEQQQAIFGEELQTHVTATNRVFGYIRLNNERIDIATFQNIPSEYAGADRVPEFDTTKMISDSAIFDSFQRDLTINAIYYDLKTEDIVDYHGGLHDVREGVIDTIVDPNIIWNVNSVAAVRSIRFKSKYGARFSERCEKAMRENGIEYLNKLDDYDRSYQLEKMFVGGYSVACIETIMDYGVFATLFPQVKKYADDASYGGYVKTALAKVDKLKKEGEEISGYDAMSNIEWVALPVTIKKAKSVKKGFKLSWFKNFDCTGYEVRYSLKKNMKNAKKIKTGKLSLTVKKLKPKKKYYVQVYAYGKNDGGTVYSVASTKKAIKAA